MVGLQYAEYYHSDGTPNHDPSQYGHDSGNGYEAGSSETQSEPEERQPLHQQQQQPVQNILIDKGKTCDYT